MGKNFKEIAFKVAGIICTGCAEDMKKILSETEGILKASVNYKDEIIHIRYDPEIIDQKNVYIAVRKLVNISVIIA